MKSSNVREDKGDKSTESYPNLDEEFATSTTCHGISFWYTSTNIITRTFWILLVTAMTGAVISQIAVRLVAYHQYKTSTDISENFVAYLEFPAVTVCSFNRYFVENAGDREMRFIHTLNHLTTASYVALASSKEMKENLTVLKAMSHNFNFTRFVDKFGMKLDNKTMRRCMFRTGLCSHKEFRPVFTSFGKCHTFNEGDEERVQNMPGAGNGLSAVLNAKQYEYTEEPILGITEAGIKIQVHPPYEAPDVESYGVAVPVGQKAFIQMKRVDNNLMYEPWGRCDPQKENLKYFRKYSMNNCLQECYTDAVISKCGCRLYTQYWARDSARECTIFDMHECASKYIVSMKQNYSAGDCQCTIPCSFTKYELSVAYSTFPGHSTSTYIEKKWNMSEEFMQRNLLKFDVYFESMSYKTFTQLKAIDETSLLSDIGGQLGLWVGMSCVTVVEFLQYFVRKALYCCKRTRRRRSLVKPREVACISTNRTSTEPV